MPRGSRSAMLPNDRRVALGEGTGPGNRVGRPREDGALKRRVVVTGIGVVSALAIGTRGTWEALVAGETGHQAHHAL